jgi:hypothetical protein
MLMSQRSCGQVTSAVTSVGISAGISAGMSVGMSACMSAVCLLLCCLAAIGGLFWSEGSDAGVNAVGVFLVAVFVGLAVLFVKMKLSQQIWLKHRLIHHQILLLR